VTVPAAGTAAVHATGGPAVDVTATSGATLSFDDVDSTNSAGPGVLLSGLGSGTFSAGPGSTITNAATADFNLNGGSGDVTYDGTITDDLGQLVTVANTTGGIKDFNGRISDGNDGDGSGVSLSSNTGATVRFDGGLTLSTGANPAFAATGGGTVAVTAPAGAPNNTLATTTGVALNVTNTTIGAAGLRFERLDANGASSGIVLNNTGSTGGLTVTGTGAAGSGGTIQNTTSDSIALSATRDVSLASMNVLNSLESGILGSAVTGLNLAGSTLTGNGDDSGDVGIKVTNLWGTSAWSDLSVTGSELANVFIDNTSGTLSSLAVTGASHFDSLGTAFGGNSFLLNIRGTAAMTSGSITGATFAHNAPARGISVQAQEAGRIGDGSGNAFTVQSSTFTNNGLQASFEQSGTADLTFRLLDNGQGVPMTMPADGTSHAVNVFSSSNTTGGTVRGRIAGNRIGDAGTAGSGSAIGNGIRALIQGRTAATLLIDANVIRQTPQARGIDVQFLGPLDSGGAPTGDITVTGNDVDPQDSTGFPASAIYIGADSQGGGAFTLRADIRGNTVPGGAASDGLPTFLALDQVVPAAACQLVDTGPASADASEQLTSTNTGSASASPGCALIPGPITTAP
jgi:hypothetical protein